MKLLSKQKRLPSQGSLIIVHTTSIVCIVVVTNLIVSILLFKVYDRIPSTTPGAEPPRDAKDSGSARSH